MAEKKAIAKPKTKKGKVALYGTLGVGGLLLAYYLYRHYQETGSLNPLSSGGATGTTSGPPSTDTSGGGGSSPATTGTPSTTPAGGSWEQRILNYMTSTFGIKGGENVAAIGLKRAMSGHCVGPNEYAALNAALGAIGQPSGRLLVLQQCPGKAPTTTVTHTPTEHPTGTPKPQGGAPSNVDNARRRANDIAANARKRANDIAANRRRSYVPAGGRRGFQIPSFTKPIRGASTVHAVPGGPTDTVGVHGTGPFTGPGHPG